MTAQDHDPAVSVVVPTRGRPDLVVRAVGSVLRQTMPDLEVVVVVDGPDDATHASLAAIDDWTGGNTHTARARDHHPPGWFRPTAPPTDGRLDSFCRFSSTRRGRVVDVPTVQADETLIPAGPDGRLTAGGVSGETGVCTRPNSGEFDECTHTTPPRQKV